MAKLSPLSNKIDIPRISDPQNFKRFLNLLNYKFECESVEDRGEYVVGHHRIKLQRDQDIDIVVYNTDVVLIRATPNTSNKIFSEVSILFEKIARQAIAPISTVRPVTTQRAKTLLDYASTLDKDEDILRMVIIILCDTANEIILREKMQDLGIQGKPLDEGIPDKIKNIEKKDHIVYKAKEVRNIRDLRNGIVHRGNIPDRTQAIICLEVTSDLYIHT